MAHLSTYLNRIREEYNGYRIEYTRIHDSLKQEEDNYHKSQRSTELTLQGKRKRQDYYYEVKKELTDELHALINDSHASFQGIRNEVEKAFAKRFSISTEAIDHDAMTLLESGILSDRELVSLSNNYTTNPTMSRILGKYIGERAAMKNDTEMRVLAERLSATVSPHLEAVDNLIYVAELGLREDRVLGDGIARGLFDKTANEIIANSGDICTE